MLRCADGSLYCGISTDVKRRLQQHNAGTGARYTRGRGPVKLLRRWQAASHGAALRAERWFKNLNREQKEARLQSRTRSDGLARCLRALPLG